MTGEEARQRTVEGELALARECLEEARYALGGGFHRLARARAYYACFHAATAVFAARGKAFRRHTGLQSAVDVELVKTGLVPEECSVALRGLYQARLRSDYGDVAPVSEADAARAVADAEKVTSLLMKIASRPDQSRPPRVATRRPRSPSHHLHQPLGSRVRLRDYDLDVAPQRIQKPKQPIARKAVEPSGKQRRDLRLGDAQHFSGFRLRKAPALNDLVNSCCKLCLREIVARVGNVDVGKHVSTAAVNTIGWHVTFRTGPGKRPSHSLDEPTHSSGFGDIGSTRYSDTWIIPFLGCKVNRRQVAVRMKVYVRSLFVKTTTPAAALTVVRAAASRLRELLRRDPAEGFSHPLRGQATAETLAASQVRLDVDDQARRAGGDHGHGYGYVRPDGVAVIPIGTLGR